MFCLKCGKELPDIAIFCSFCGAKLEEELYQDSKQKKEEGLQKEETTVLLKNLIHKGNESLENMQPEEADKYFEQAISMDFECAEAYWGYVLLKNKCRNTDEFISKLTEDPEPVPKEVYEAVSYEESVQHAVERYLVNGFLYEEKIRQIFSYDKDISYYSEVKYREEQYEHVKNYFEHPEDPNLKKVFRFAAGNFYNKIVKMQDTIYSILEDKLAQAKEQDLQQITCITKEYQEFWEQAEQTVKEEYEKACRQQDVCYEEACEYMSMSDYETAKIRFEKIGEYKDSLSRLAECNRIKELERIRANNRNAYDNTTRKNDTGGFGWGLLGCLIPVVGLVLWLVWKDEKPRTAKAVIKGTILSIVTCILAYILVFVVGILGFMFY